MSSRGLKASPEGIRAAKTALTDKTLSQQKLATTLGITRQPVSKFFAGEPVSRSCFVQICQQLGLSWQQVAGIHLDWVAEGTAKAQTHNFDLNTVVQELRQKYQDKIQDQCHTIQMLDVAWPIKLDAIYTHVNVVEEIISQQWREIADLLPISALEPHFYQQLQNNHRHTLPGLEAVLRYSKLMVLGKLGSGKTTFLQYLAIACNQGKIQPRSVPVFVRLKEFAEDANYDTELNLSDYISEQFSCCGIDEAATVFVLTQGRALILLDGLDEVPSEYTDAVIRAIRKFYQIYYKNQFVISCRTAAHKYRFPGFTEVELADFNDQQIEIFVRNWFAAVAHQSLSKAEATSNLFIQLLNLPENQPIRELASTPLFLHLICLLFQVKGQFPEHLTNLYEQILNVLLVRWDEIRGIKRDDIYTDLSLVFKKKLIAQIAVVTFAAGEYFFTRERIQELITDYLPSIAYRERKDFILVRSSYSPTDSPRRNSWLSHEQSPTYLDTKLIFEGLILQDGLLVERARGIYSFSHLSLLEYLTARNLVDNYREISGQALISQITQERWHHVFLLTVNMLSNVDQTIELIKNQVDAIVANDEKIQQYLVWLKQKTHTVATKNQPAAIRAFYFVCSYGFGETANYSIEWDYVRNLDFTTELSLDELLFSILNCVHELKLGWANHIQTNQTFNHARALVMTLDEAIDLVWDLEFQQKLQQIKKQLPCTESNPEKFSVWWQENGIIWEKELRNNLCKYRQIGYDWQWEEQQIELLNKYLIANKLLIDCLRKSVNINPELRQRMEAELFVAIAQ